MMASQGNPKHHSASPPFPAACSQRHEEGGHDARGVALVGPEEKVDDIGLDEGDECRRGAAALAFNNVALSRAFATPGPTVGDQLEESELHLLLGVGGNKSAFALSTQQQTRSCRAWA